MKEIFETLVNIKTPLGLAGGALAVAFFILRAAIQKNGTVLKMFGGDKKLLSKISHRVFILALVTIVLYFGTLYYDMHNKAELERNKILQQPTEKAISFNVLEFSSGKPMDSVAVSLLNANTAGIVTNGNGYFNFNLPLRKGMDTLLVYFMSYKYAIDTTWRVSIEHFPGEFRFVKRSPISYRPREKKQQKVTTGLAGTKSKIFTDNAKSLLYSASFGSSVNDVVGREFGQPARNSMSYQSLPAAVECTTQVVKYLWRYIKKSNVQNNVYSLLAAYGLRDDITDDSYVIYSFVNQELRRIEIRFLSSDDHFYTLLMHALGKNIDSNSSFKVLNGDFNYFASTYPENGLNITRLVITDKAGADICSGDWWNLKK